MIYNVFSVTLNPTQSITLGHWAKPCRQNGSRDVHPAYTPL